MLKLIFIVLSLFVISSYSSTLAGEFCSSAGNEICIDWTINQTAQSINFTYRSIVTGWVAMGFSLVATQPFPMVPGVAWVCQLNASNNNEVTLTTRNLTNVDPEDVVIVNRDDTEFLGGSYINNVLECSFVRSLVGSVNDIPLGDFNVQMIMSRNNVSATAQNLLSYHGPVNRWYTTINLFASGSPIIRS